MKKVTLIIAALVAAATLAGARTASAGPNSRPGFPQTPATPATICSTWTVSFVPRLGTLIARRFIVKSYGEAVQLARSLAPYGAVTIVCQVSE